MDILSKSNRMSYVAAWGAMTHLAFEMTFGETQIVSLQGPTYVTIWNKILSMAVIGVGYFPMFAGLALDSLVSLAVTFLYACVLLAVDIYKIFECELIPTARLIFIVRDLPSLACLGYLCVSIPVCIFHGLRSKSLRIFTSSERVSFLGEDKDLESTSEAEHVRDLLRPPKPPPPAARNLKEKVAGIAKSVFARVIYQNKHKYRYSTRVLSVTVMGIILLYLAVVEFFVMILPLFTILSNGFKETLDGIGREFQLGEDEWITETRDEFILFEDLIQDGRICVIVSLTFAGATGVLSILHMLTSYRTNMLSLYKGDNTHIPHRSEFANTGLLLGSMKYSGFQIAYIGWGFILHLICFLLISVALCVLIIILMEGYTEWLIGILATTWPAWVMTIVLMVVQKLSAKFFFLQDRGLLLAMNNRRALFSFSFFLFFYNIFLGFLSCLMRIIKSIVIGTIFLSRLDNSALPRRFQMMDPGFAAYVGFLHMECSHTHPVLLMFVRILMAGKKKRDEAVNDPEKPEITEEKARAFVRARIRWQTAYSILKNPALRATRKCHLDHVKELQERLSKMYHLDKNQTSEVMKEMQRSGVDINDVNESLQAEGKPSSADNLVKALKMNNFLQKMRRDKGLGLGVFASRPPSEEITEMTFISPQTDRKGASNDDLTTYKQWKSAAFTALEMDHEKKMKPIKMSDIKTNV
ncbi:stimulated by retinoic acid gene 6 protein-like [Dreissena polymorpha]|uniref:stimulated by retinoic acid gene 6 protein-like n=1 Tax=Dreissena polymorpha TaxID=45954 RepID=UPI0022652BF7|nr:stimulated by retinoic acid gene 6 protein-like [Dreissena polymorpha]